MRRVVGIAVAAIFLAVLAYLSRFWVFRWWERDGLFGIEVLRPQGELWARWMRDLGLGPYELVLWAIAAFAVLSLAQKLWDSLFNRE
ncbi:MAG: hypothetical protein AAF367_17790 [Pseudomonadota bacterium]